MSNNKSKIKDQRSKCLSAKQNQIGQSLIELVIVVAVVVIVVGALVFATIASLRNAQFAKNQSQATKLAQEGIERVRTGRDRNQPISSNVGSVSSWNGDVAGSGSIWGCRISSGSCYNATPNPGDSFYFKVDSQGILTYLTVAQDIPPTAESIPVDNPQFKRVIILSDDATFYDTQKTVTAIVRWVDFSGMHESKLNTYLRKIQ